MIDEYIEKIRNQFDSKLLSIEKSISDKVLSVFNKEDITAIQLPARNGLTIIELVKKDTLENIVVFEYGIESGQLEKIEDTWKSNSRLRYRVTYNVKFFKY